MGPSGKRYRSRDKEMIMPKDSISPAAAAHPAGSTFSDGFRLLLIVPAYNEEENIRGVIRDAREHFPSADILVVNDGSEDCTSRAAKELGVAVVDLPYNLGIGGAMQTGFHYALWGNYTAAVQFDGDGQHRADEIPKVLEPLQCDSADLIVGSRFLSASVDYKSSFQRTLGRKVFSYFLSAILQQKATDCTSGFRVYSRRAIELFSRHYPEDYPEVESLVFAHKKRLRIMEVPVRMRQRTTGKSSITTFKAIYYMAKVLLAVCIDLLRKAD